MIADQIPIASAALASFDPSGDDRGRMADAALTLLTELANLAGAAPRSTPSRFR